MTPTVLMGRTEPRLWTRPLRDLTPMTSAGYAAITFAEDVLQITLLPWHKWWLIHAFELKPDGTFRFRTVLTLVARQSGKTFLLKIVALYFMYVRYCRMVLGAAQSLDIAREAWQGAVEMAEGNQFLAAEIATVRKANGEQCLTLSSGARYRISAATRSAGRGLSVDLLILDELREHRDWAAWSALSKTTAARASGLIVGISNAGDDDSIVLNSLRAAALSGEDPSIFLAEWSAPDGCELDDPAAWAQANPGLGYTVSEAAISSAMATDPPAVFRTEMLCQRVLALDAAIDLEAWREGADLAGTLADIRDRVAVCVEVAIDGAHVTLTGAGVTPSGKVRVEVLAAWATTEEARSQFPSIIRRIRPAALGWFPTGPAAVLGPDFIDMESALIAQKCQLYELKGAEVAQTCQGFADLVSARRILHSDDPLLNAHVSGAQRLISGDGWRFGRMGHGNVDAAYAVAGAVHIVRTLPVPIPIPRSKIY